MSRFVKTCLVVVLAGALTPSVALAKKVTSKASADQAADSSSPHDRSFEETREFMKKHSEESKRTGKM